MVVNRFLMAIFLLASRESNAMLRPVFRAVRDVSQRELPVSGRLQLGMRVVKQSRNNKAARLLGTAFLGGLLFRSNCIADANSEERVYIAGTNWFASDDSVISSEGALTEKQKREWLATSCYRDPELFKKFVAQLIQSGKNPFDYRDCRDRNPLLVACELGDLVSLKLLMQHGGIAKINQAGMPELEGWTRLPLALAIIRGHVDIVEYLLANHKEFDIALFRVEADLIGNHGEELADTQGKAYQLFQSVIRPIREKLAREDRERGEKAKEKHKEAVLRELKEQCTKSK